MSDSASRPRRLPLELNPSLGMPIYRQIVDGIRRMVAGGVLKPGDRLPSIRDLAITLRINPSSAVKAYDALRHAGVIHLDHGRGTFVSGDPATPGRARTVSLDQELDRLLAAARILGVKPDILLDRLRQRIRARKQGGHHGAD